MPRCSLRFLQSESCCRSSLYPFPKLLRFFVGVFVLTFGVNLTGCGTKTIRPVRFKATSAQASIVQEGDVETPAKLDTAQTTIETLAPKGSEIIVEPSGTVRFETPRDVPVTSTTVASKIVGPVSVKPPSPSEVARGVGVRVFYWGGALLGLAACFAGYRGHAKAAVVFGIGALGMPLVANIASTQAAIVVGGISILVGGTLFAAWHFVRDRHPEIESK